MRIFGLFMLIGMFLLSSCKSNPDSKESISETQVQLKGDTSALVIIWTSQDKEVALKTALSYALNAKLNGWMQNVTLLVWGPSVQLLAKDQEIQNVFTYMKQAGVSVLVDKKCAEEYNLTKELEALHLEIRSLGKPLTVFIQQKRTIISF